MLVLGLLALAGLSFWLVTGSGVPLTSLADAIGVTQAVNASEEVIADSAEAADSRARPARKAGRNRKAVAPEVSEPEFPVDTMLLADLDTRARTSLAMPVLPDGFPHDRPVSERMLTSASAGDHSNVPVLRNREEARRLIEKHYPPHLKAIGVGGTVVLSLLVDETGRVRDQWISRGSQESPLNRAALRAAAELQFTPARRFGRNVKAEHTFSVVFKP